MALASTALLTACDGDGDENDAGGDTGNSRYCEHDDLLGPGSAGELTAGAGDELVAEGYVCPVLDADWYHLTVPSGHHLLRVNLSVTGPGSPVQPTYTVYECDEECVSTSPEGEQQNCCDARVAPRTEEVSDRVEVTHCIEPGDYYIVVRDLGDDSQDDREPRGIYNLAVSTVEDADTSEPNDGPDSAAALDSSGGSWTARGQIACRGDQDWYALDSRSGITVNDNDLLDIQVTAPISTMQLQYVIMHDNDGTLEQIASDSNPSGTVEETDLKGFFQLASSGTYYVVIQDDDGGEADPGATYEVRVSIVDDDDPNEPNNTPTEATALGSLSCGDSWATVSNSGGSISATNDVDIFTVPLDAGCANGILEATVSFSGSPPEGLEPSVRIIRPHPESPCSTDSDCRVLQIECDNEDPAGALCAGFGNVCGRDDLCTGASLCLAGGSCGANIIERHPDFCGGDGHCHGPTGAMRNRPCSVDTDCAPQNEISTAIPIGRNPTGAPSAIDRVYIIVSDFSADVADPGVEYTLTVRARRDPDTNEPNEVYNPLLNDDATPTAEGLATPASWGGCISGRLSYERDQDVFLIPHPCPGTNCTLSMSYELGSGPVEIYSTTRSAWDNLTDLDPDSDSASNSSRSGSLGGAGDCLPANTRINDELQIVVRDIEINRDWSVDQTYRICFDTPTAGCNAPCVDVGGDCWYPPED